MRDIKVGDAIDKETKEHLMINATSIKNDVLMSYGMRTICISYVIINKNVGNRKRIKISLGPWQSGYALILVARHQPPSEYTLFQTTLKEVSSLVLGEHCYLHFLSVQIISLGYQWSI